jgi:predicted PurR-regulated permease PerM
MSDRQSEINKSISTSVEVSIRLIFLFILIGWCISLLIPFVTIVLWAVIIAVSIDPLFDWFNRLLGNSPTKAAILITVLLLAVIIVPASIFVTGIADDAQRIGRTLTSDDFQVPVPDPSVKDWPIIGEKVHTAWQQAYDNPEKAIAAYGPQIKKAGKVILQSAMSITGDLFKMLAAIIIAGVLLATPGTQKFTHQFFVKLVGTRGSEFADLTEKTIRNVTKGILGVAIIQSSMLTAIFFLAGVPYAGLLGLFCLMLGIMQLPSLPIAVFAVVWMYSSGELSTTMATVWTILLLLASLSDNVLKPILLGKGAPVPMLVIFLGAIGGFIMSGFLGLFTGAIILSLGYKLFIQWIVDPADNKEKETTGL